MLTVLILATIGIGVSIYRRTNNGWCNEFLEYLLDAILGAFIGLVVGFCLAFLLPMDIRRQKESIKIVNLNDTSDFNGDFFLGCGKIEGKMKYVFYCEQENGFFKMMQLDCDIVQIKYSDSTPNILVISDTPTDAFINMFAIDITNTTYIIEVPYGTIKNNFNLDAK